MPRKPPHGTQKARAGGFAPGTAGILGRHFANILSNLMKGMTKAEPFVLPPEVAEMAMDEIEHVAEVAGQYCAAHINPSKMMTEKESEYLLSESLKFAIQTIKAMRATKPARATK